MTTVAFNNGVLAADSQWIEDGVKFTNAKAWKDEEHGVIVAFAGSAEVAFDVLGAVFDERAPLGPQGEHPDQEQTDLIMLYRTGRFEVLDEFGRACSYDPTGMYAWGSGAAAAMSAMILGCSPAKAVETAAKVCPMTGGPVTEVSW